MGDRCDLRSNGRSIRKSNRLHTKSTILLPSPKTYGIRHGFRTLWIAVALCTSPLFAFAQHDAGIRDSVPADSAVFDTIVHTGLVTVSAEDTMSRREVRRQRQYEKYLQSGPFFDHSERPARKAALYSFAFPGLGQIYNRKYWKLPIVYGLIGTGMYFAVSNGIELKRYNTALELRLAGGGDEFDGILTTNELTFRRNTFRRNTELSAILTGLAYGLNIIDAVVDAHLFEFDISDDLSLRWSPDFLTGNRKAIPAIHISLTFN